MHIQKEVSTKKFIHHTRNIIKLCNLSDIIYNYCNEHTEMSIPDRKNLKSLCTGIQQVHRSISQYDNKSIDKILIATIFVHVHVVNDNIFKI